MRTKQEPRSLAGTTQFKNNVIFQGKCFPILKAPRNILYRLGDLFPLSSPQRLKPHGILEHGQYQGNGRVGADDLSLESLPNQCRQQTDVIDMRMGGKK